MLLAGSVIQTQAKNLSFGLNTGAFIIDQASRRIDVRKPYERIISLYGAHTENLFSLGLDAQIIGVSPNEAYPPKVRSKPVFSYHDDPERFMAAKPDLVLIRPMIDRGYPQLVQRLEKSAITVVSLQPGTIDEMYAYWEILGILTGKRDRALQMIAEFRKKVSEIKSLTASIYPKKKVYFEAIHKQMKTFSPDAMAMFALDAAGGVNVAVDAQQVRSTNIAFYGKEKILSRADEIDVFIAQKGAMNRPTISLIKTEPGFSAIKAVQTDQILIIDEMTVSRPTLRLIHGILEIGRFLYPEIFMGGKY